MQALPDNVVDYLNKFSTCDYEIEWNESSGINYVIVIPAIAEYDNIKILLDTISRCESTYFSTTLILFVINNPPSAVEEVKADNRNSLWLLREIISGNQSNEFTEKIIYSGLQIGLVDASSTGKELDENNSGVGLARKIGMDLALTVFDYSVSGKKIILCLDADCTVSENYITAVADEFNYQNCNAAIVNFEHLIDEKYETNDAIICYELFLRYYVAGLRYAKSDYAFHTIGSTMVCDHIAYIKTGGMNKREAAEDFYFLEKVSKSYKIFEINSATVYPSSRKSWRVPFGTGQRVTRFLEQTYNEYLLFDPEVFELLRLWMVIFNSEELITTAQYLDAAKKIHEELYYFLLKQDFEKQWDKIFSNSKSKRQLELQKKLWFDGFKTLKLIHHLRDTAFPQLNMFDALDKMFNKLKIDSKINKMGADIPLYKIQIEYLQLLRELDRKTINNQMQLL